MKRYLLIVLMLITWIWGHALAGDKAAPACPDQKTLTRDARLALVDAQKLMEEDKSGEALSRLKAFNEKYPDENHAFVSFTMAGLYLETGEMEKAAAQYETTIGFCPVYAPAWQNLGKVCYDLGKFVRAAEALEKTWHLTGKKNHLVLFHAAVARLSAEQPKTALSHIEFLTSGQAGPPEENWVKLLVQLSIENKRSARAVKTVERLLAIPEPRR